MIKRSPQKLAVPSTDSWLIQTFAQPCRRTLKDVCVAPRNTSKSPASADDAPVISPAISASFATVRPTIGRPTAKIMNPNSDSRKQFPVCSKRSFGPKPALRFARNCDLAHIACLLQLSHARADALAIITSSSASRVRRGIPKRGRVSEAKHLEGCNSRSRLGNARFT